MTQMSKAAKQARERALKAALTEVLGSDEWVDEEPDLYHAVDEIIAADETLGHLVRAEGSLCYADACLRDRHDFVAGADETRFEREADDMTATAERAVADAARARAVELIEGRLDDAREYLDGDVTLAELEGEN